MSRARKIGAMAARLELSNVFKRAVEMAKRGERTAFLDEYVVGHLAELAIIDAEEVAFVENLKRRRDIAVALVGAERELG